MNEKICVCEECKYSETKKYTLPNLVYCTKKQEFKEKREFCSECEKQNRN